MRCGRRPVEDREQRGHVDPPPEGHHPQARVGLAHGVQHAVDEHSLAVKDVDLGICDLAMGAQGQTNLCHSLQHLCDFVEIRDTAG